MPIMTRPDDLAASAGRRLADVRKALGLSQRELAKAITVSSGSIGNWEAGERTPDITAMLRLRAKFGVTTDYIYAGSMIGLPGDIQAKILTIQSNRTA